MINREKVIRHIAAEISIARTCKKDFASVDIDMLSDAYELLKEQEAVVPVYTTNSHPFHIGILYRCGNCHHSLIRDEDLFCRHCGKPIDWTKKAVKWE